MTGPDEGPKRYSSISNWEKKIISISTNKMIVEFVTEGSEWLQNDRGFFAHYYFTRKNKECELWLAMNKTILKSPNYPGSYQNSMKCRWLITGHHDNHITLDLIEFHVR